MRRQQAYRAFKTIVLREFARSANSLVFITLIAISG